MGWKTNPCPECGKSLWRRYDTGKYHCSRCKCAFRLTKVERDGGNTAVLRLFVAHRPMLVAEAALRLGATSQAVRQWASRSPDLYVWDGMVRSGVKPDYLA